LARARRSIPCLSPHLDSVCPTQKRRPTHFHLLRSTGLTPSPTAASHQSPIPKQCPAATPRSTHIGTVALLTKAVTVRRPRYPNTPIRRSLSTYNSVSNPCNRRAPSLRLAPKRLR